MMTITCTLRALAICSTWACLAANAQTITPLADFKSGPVRSHWWREPSVPSRRSLPMPWKTLTKLA